MDPEEEEEDEDGCGTRSETEDNHVQDTDSDERRRSSRFAEEYEIDRGYQYDSYYYYHHMHHSVFVAGFDDNDEWEEEWEEVRLNRMDQENLRMLSIRIPSLPSSYHFFGTFSGNLAYTLEIDPTMWSTYPYDRIVSYAQSFRLGANALQGLDPLQIMKRITIGPQVVVVLKTFWLRLVQRTWKRIYKERVRVIALRCSPRCHRHMELTGRYIEGAHSLPRLQGMFT